MKGAVFMQGRGRGIHAGQLKTKGNRQGSRHACKAAGSRSQPAKGEEQNGGRKHRATDDVAFSGWIPGHGSEAFIEAFLTHTMQAAPQQFEAILASIIGISQKSRVIDTPLGKGPKSMVLSYTAKRDAKERHAKAFAAAPGLAQTSAAQPGLEDL